MTQATLGLAFGNGVSDLRRRRVTHAARSYAAIYGLRWDDRAPRARLCYGVGAVEPNDVATSVGDPTLDLRLANYPDLFLDAEAREFPQLHPTGDGQPDWLAEIFEWLGGEVEARSEGSDGVGAVPYGDTLCGRFGLDPEVPWAAVAMRGLNAQIARVVDDWPSGPEGTGSPIVVATHDLDFLPLAIGENVRRALKNSLIALLLQRSPRLALSNLRGLVRWPDIPKLLQHEIALGTESSWYVIAAHHHRRDANYELGDPRVTRILDGIRGSGMEIGVHGSYESILGGGSLSVEYDAVRRLGDAVIGGRQHWLRYRPAQLWTALNAAGASYDASAGFAARLGFRAGAPFAYVPWSFSDEMPLSVLEFPMVIMDATLFAQDGYDRRAAWDRAERILRRARVYGPGGVSVVWHNTGFGGVQLPPWIGDMYWDLDRTNLRWISGRTAARHLAARFRAAGFRLPSV